MPFIEVGFPGVANPADVLVAIGPSTNVEIGFDPATYAALAGIPAPVLPQAGQTFAPPQLVPALIDTGAQESMIDEALAVGLGLPLINRQQVLGIGGAHAANVYLAHLIIPALGGRAQLVHLWARNSLLAAKSTKHLLVERSCAGRCLSTMATVGLCAWLSEHTAVLSAASG